MCAYDVSVKSETNDISRIHRKGEPAQHTSAYNEFPIMVRLDHGPWTTGLCRWFGRPRSALWLTISLGSVVLFLKILQNFAKYDFIDEFEGTNVVIRVFSSYIFVFSFAVFSVRFNTTPKRSHWMCDI